MALTPEEIKAAELANEEIGDAITNLLHTVAKHNGAVAGFVWGATPPIFTAFGNCTDHVSPRLFDALTEMAQTRRDAGLSIKIHVPRMA